jgi:glutamyl-tRNA reductase
MVEGSSNHDEQKLKGTLQIGIIGMGDMGRLYANKFAEGGWKL